MTTDTLLQTRDERTAVDKAISLMIAFGTDGASGVGVSELARRAGLSKSTSYRVLAMLERNGVIERVGRDYRLGARLHELGRSVYAPKHDEVRDRLTPFLTDLYEATGEAVQLVGLHGTDTICLAKLFGHRQVRMPGRVGGRLPAYATAAGKALLAFDADALELTLAQRSVALTTATVHAADALQQQLADVRRAGLACDEEEAAPGLSSLAAPVFGPGGAPAAAISVSTASDRLDRNRLEPALRAIAGAATRSLRRTIPGRSRVAVSA